MKNSLFVATMIQQEERLVKQNLMELFNHSISIIQSKFDQLSSTETLKATWEFATFDTHYGDWSFLNVNGKILMLFSLIEKRIIVRERLLIQLLFNDNHLQPQRGQSYLKESLDDFKIQTDVAVYHQEVQPFIQSVDQEMIETHLTTLLTLGESASKKLTQSKMESIHGKGFRTDLTATLEYWMATNQAIDYRQVPFLAYGGFGAYNLFDTHSTATKDFVKAIANPQHFKTELIQRFNAYLGANEMNLEQCIDVYMAYQFAHSSGLPSFKESPQIRFKKACYEAIQRLKPQTKVTILTVSNKLKEVVAEFRCDGLGDLFESPIPFESIEQLKLADDILLDRATFESMFKVVPPTITEPTLIPVDVATYNQNKTKKTVLAKGQLAMNLFA